MKKLFLLFAMVCMAQLLFAQNISLSPMVVEKDGGKILKNIDLKSLHQASAKGTTRWYNYGETMDAILGGGVSVIYGNNLFPDSTILVDYGTSGYSGPWIHALGDVLDVSAANFNDPGIYSGVLNLSKTSTFNVDSIGMYFYYYRNLSSSIIDTLVFEVAVNNTLPNYYFTGGTQLNTNLNADTVFFKGLAYTYTTNSLNLSGKKIYKFPMDQAFCDDTLDNGLNYAEISTADLPTVTAGKYVTLSVKFIPGYTWIPNVDTLSQKNSVLFLSYKEQDYAWPFYTKHDYNVSYIIPRDVRYNVAGGWNGLYIPSFAYMGGTDPSTTIAYQHHLIYYKVNCQTNCGTIVGIQDVQENNTSQLGDAYPNPANAGTELIIPFNLNTSNENTTLTIYNSIGQVILNYNYNDYVQGEYKTTVNTSNLKAGLYFYSLKTLNGSITKYFMLAE